MISHPIIITNKYSENYGIFQKKDEDSFIETALPLSVLKRQVRFYLLSFRL